MKSSRLAQNRCFSPLYYYLILKAGILAQLHLQNIKRRKGSIINKINFFFLLPKFQGVAVICWCPQNELEPPQQPERAGVLTAHRKAWRLAPLQSAATQAAKVEIADRLDTCLLLCSSQWPLRTGNKTLLVALGLYIYVDHRKYLGIRHIQFHFSTTLKIHSNI